MILGCGGMEAPRIQQLPSTLGYWAFIICYIVGEVKDDQNALLVGIIILMVFWLWSALMLLMYGDETLDEMADPTGPCGVGLKRFHSKQD